VFFVGVTTWQSGI